MKRSKFVADVCRQIGVSEARFNVWKKQLVHLGVAEVRRMRQLANENKRPALVADLTSHRHMLAEALRRKPKDDAAPQPGDLLMQAFRVPVVLACALPDFRRAAWCRPSTAKDQSALRLRIRELALARPRFGVQRIWVLLRREGWRVNLKRVRRFYCVEGLHLRQRVRRRKHRALHRGPAPVPTGPTQRWSMDVVHDTLADGRPFRILTVVDQWSRQRLILEVGFRMNGTTVGDALDAAIETYGKPVSVTCDHGTEFTSRVLGDWACTRGAQLDYTRPGKPTDNSYIESFNGKLRDECLNVTQFADLTYAQQLIAAWRTDFNRSCPHGALGRLTPKELADARQASHLQEAA